MRIESPTTCNAWYCVSPWADSSSHGAPESESEIFFSFACSANDRVAILITFHIGKEENSRRSVPDSI
jgi:hypothetical protein